MKQYVKPCTFEDEVIDYLTIIIGDIIDRQAASRVAIKVGKHPCAQYYPTKQDYDTKQHHNYLQGRCDIHLPIIKNMSHEFFEKLKMFAAHEAGHVAYTFPHPVLNIEQKNACDKKDWLKLNAMNGFEDIRIEWELERKRIQSSTLKRLLPVSFKNFRKLVYGQTGTTRRLDPDTPEEKKKFDKAYYLFGRLLLKSQLDLIGFSHIINEPEVKEAYDTNFAPIIAANKHYGYNNPKWTIKITKEFLDMFKKVFPQEAQDLNDHQDQADSDQGQSTDSPQTGESGEGKEGKGKKGKKGESESIGNKSAYKSEDVGPLQGKEVEEALKKAMQSGGAGGGDVQYEDRKKNSLSLSEIAKVLRQYGNAVSAFNRMFCGGWRAPSHKVYTETDEGEIDPEFLYKAKFGGKDRTIYQDTRKAIAEGLNVLCVFDNSGSMSHAQMRKVLDMSIIIDKACAVRNNIKARLVYFTNRTIVARDYDDKSAKFDTLSDLMNDQGGTPTGEVLQLELPKLLSRKGSKFLVVVTDGQPNDVQKTKAALQRYREFGVKILYVELDGGGNTFKDSVDYYIEYDSEQMERMPIVLSKDILQVVRDHAKKSLKGVA